LRVLIGCEFSGAVRREFRKLGHEAYSCDILPAEDGGEHIQDDILKVISRRWDLAVFFPPCTYLCRAAARWHWGTPKQREAIRFVIKLWNSGIPRIGMENPVGALTKAFRKPNQIIQPWQFGHGEIKKTCLWTSGLPLLRPTRVVKGREPRVHWAAPGPDRWKERSRTLPGIARAMATQWGSI
jgi:hypothetical protein